MSVSYTHLDVYKRQQMNRSSKMQLCWFVVIESWMEGTINSPNMVIHRLLFQLMHLSAKMVEWRMWMSIISRYERFRWRALYLKLIDRWKSSSPVFERHPSCCCVCNNENEVMKELTNLPQLTEKWQLISL